MTGQNQLIDRKALLQNRARRVTQQGSFLHDLAIADVQDRLMMVNKSFKDIVIVTGWADPWAAAFPEARVIEDTDVLDLSVQSCDLIIHALALHAQTIQWDRSFNVHAAFGQMVCLLRSALVGRPCKNFGVLWQQLKARLQAGCRHVFCPWLIFKIWGHCFSAQTLHCPWRIARHKPWPIQI